MRFFWPVPYEPLITAVAQRLAVHSWTDLGSGTGERIAGITAPLNLQSQTTVSPSYSVALKGWMHGGSEIGAWLHTATAGDCVSLLDVIEHFERSEAERILDRVEHTFRVVVIFTPRGFMRQDSVTDRQLAGDPLMWHRSGFTERDFEARSYVVGYWPIFHFRPHGIYGAILAIHSDQPQIAAQTMQAIYRSMIPGFGSRARWLGRVALHSLAGSAGVTLGSRLFRRLRAKA